MRASTVAPNTAPITGRSGICITTSTRIVQEPGTTTTVGAATGRVTTGTPPGTGMATPTDTVATIRTGTDSLIRGEDRQFPTPQEKGGAIGGIAPLILSKKIRWKANSTTFGHQLGQPSV